MIARLAATSRGVSLRWRQRLAVVAGGVVGSAVRVALDAWSETPPGGWPWATFTVNLAGAFLLGLLLPRLLAGVREGSLAAPLLAPGVFGSLTTFSLFTLEVWTLAEAGRPVLAAGYAVASLSGGLALAALGDVIARWRR